ncbi:MAG: acyl-CoA thioesterase [Burkholderiaceae bacterium]
MMDSFESVLSRSPFFIVQRQVRWSDCDPAGVVYTGRFPEFVLSAVGLFYAELAQGSYREWIKAMGVDTPCKGLKFDFQGALWPDDKFQMQCTVPVIRTHSYDIRIEARQADERRVFRARFSPICIGGGVRTGVPIPAQMRQRLESFASSAE